MNMDARAGVAVVQVCGGAAARDDGVGTLGSVKPLRSNRAGRLSVGAVRDANAFRARSPGRTRAQKMRGERNEVDE
jgi:hypothetical protein